jgi:hypothetical protein
MIWIRSQYCGDGTKLGRKIRVSQKDSHDMGGGNKKCISLPFRVELSV